MTELYSLDFQLSLKKRRLYFLIGFVLLLAASVAAYILSISLIGKEWVTMLLGIFAVLVLTSYYIAFLAPVEATLKMLKEVQNGLQTEEVLVFDAAQAQETVKDGIPYIPYIFIGTDEKGTPFERKLFLDKRFNPLNLTKGRTYRLRTYQGIVLSYGVEEN